MAQIGIKLADGTFYPVLQDTSPQRKRVILSAARPGQSSVQVDLVQRDGDHDQFVGCLVLEELPAGDAVELELRLAIDREGTLDAQIHDARRTQYQSLAVDLHHLGEDAHFSIPEEDTADIGTIDVEFHGEADTPHRLDDIELDSPEGEVFQDDLSLQDEVPAGEHRDSGLADSDYADDSEDTDHDEDHNEDHAASSFNLVILIALVLVVLSLLALGAWLVLLLLDARPQPELRAAAVVPAFLWFASPGSLLPRRPR